MSSQACKSPAFVFSGVLRKSFLSCHPVGQRSSFVQIVPNEMECTKDSSLRSGHARQRVTAWVAHRLGGGQVEGAGGWFLVFLYTEDLLPFDHSRELSSWIHSLPLISLYISILRSLPRHCMMKQKKALPKLPHRWKWAIVLNYLCMGPWFLTGLFPLCFKMHPE